MSNGIPYGFNYELFMRRFKGQKKLTRKQRRIAAQSKRIRPVVGKPTKRS